MRRSEDPLQPKVAVEECHPGWGTALVGSQAEMPCLALEPEQMVVILEYALAGGL